MITIGLLAGVAGGKSTVAGLLAQHGAVVLDADRAAHEVLDSPEVVESLVDRFGEQTLEEGGRVARSFIAERVFGDSEEAAANRRFLEELVHPAVGRRLRAELGELRQQDVSAVVLDVPLLLEAGYAPDCDRLLFVDTPEPDRRERAAARGWSAEEFAAREAAQRPISEKRSAATDTVANHGSSQDLALAVADFWRRRVVTAEP